MTGYLEFVYGVEYSYFTANSTGTQKFLMIAVGVVQVILSLVYWWASILSSLYLIPSRFNRNHSCFRASLQLYLYEGLGCNNHFNKFKPNLIKKSYYLYFLHYGETLFSMLG